MSLDYRIATQEKQLFRRFQKSPRYFKDKVGPIIPGLISHDEARAKEEADKKDHERKEGVQRKPQPQQPHQTQALHQKQTQQALAQTAREDHAPREKGETSKSQQAAQQTKLLKEAAGQGVQELQRSEFNQPRPQIHSGLRAPSTPGANLLQNVRNLASGGSGQSGQTGLPEKQFLKGQTEGPLPNLVRDTSKPPPPSSTGVRVANLAPFTGLHEGGRPILGTSTGQPQTVWTSHRPDQPQARPFSPESPFAKLADRALSRSWNPDALTKLLAQAAKNLPDSNPALTNRAAQVAVVLHGNLLFLRDGNRLRSFRLLDDGNLWETSHEHHGVPLTPEARAEMTKVLKQKGVHARLSGEKEAFVEKQGGDQKVPKGSSTSLGVRGELRALINDSSMFAHLLREVLEEGKEMGQELEEGETPKFASKKDWAAFFGRMMGMGNAEKSSQKTFDQIMGFIFRGLFKKQGESGETLVSDFKYQLAGKLREEKFAQIGVSNTELLTLLKNLKPGEPISKETLQRFMGEELSFTQLIHVIKKTDPHLASELLRNVQFDPTANVDLYSQAKLEHHIFSQSRKKAVGDESVFANVYDLQEKQKREVPGKPKLYTFITYAAIAFGVLLLILFLLGK
jgi:hypothetical protein